jgi:hypothetical protein
LPGEELKVGKPGSPGGKEPKADNRRLAGKMFEDGRRLAGKTSEQMEAGLAP